MGDEFRFLSVFSCAQPVFVANYRRMSEGFANSRWRWVAAAIAVAAALWICYAGVNHAIAGHYAASSSADDWFRASRIEPANGENWYRLGRYRQLDFDHSDLPLAVSYYRRAVQLNPRSPYYKLDLASALEMSGDNAEAETYFRAAQSDYPISAEVSWKYGNFLLRRQRLPDAYAEIHRAVLVDPKLTSLAISRAWHSDPDVHVLLDQVLPDTAGADWETLAFLADAKEVSAAQTVWDRLIAKKPAVEWKTLAAFTDVMVAQERYDEARSVWLQATAVDAGSSPAQNDGSLVFNGGFEKDSFDGGFDWQHEEVSGADFDYDTDVKHSGARSVRITFDGTQNVWYQYPFQVVIVSPGTHYRFRGYLRTDQITTDCGIQFEILDPKDVKNLDVLTPNETGTQPWTLEEADFTPGPQTHLVRILVERKPSHHFDNKISGTVWVDDVGIFPIGSIK